MKKVIIFILLCALAVIFLLPIKNRRNEISKENEKSKILLEQIEKEKEKKEKLLEEVEEINKKENIEKFAREELNMTNENERVYKFVESKGSEDGESK